MGQAFESNQFGESSFLVRKFMWCRNDSIDPKGCLEPFWGHVLGIAPTLQQHWNDISRRFFLWLLFVGANPQVLHQVFGVTKKPRKSHNPRILAIPWYAFPSGSKRTKYPPKICQDRYKTPTFKYTDIQFNYVKHASLSGYTQSALDKHDESFQSLIPFGLRSSLCCCEAHFCLVNASMFLRFLDVCWYI